MNFLQSIFETAMDPLFDFFGPADGSKFDITTESGAQISTRGAFSVKVTRDQVSDFSDQLTANTKLDLPRREVLQQLPDGSDAENLLHGATLQHDGKTWRIDAPIDDRRAIIRCPLSLIS